MPLYEYECGCGKRFERYLPISEYDAVQHGSCGAVAKKIFTKIAKAIIQPDICYDSPIDGRPITTWKQRNEDLVRNGCIPLDSDVKKHIQTIKENNEKAFDKKIDDFVEQKIHSLDSKRIEKLSNEIDSGVALEYNRI